MEIGNFQGEQHKNLRDTEPPTATVAVVAQTLRIVHLSLEARDARIRRGQTLAEAKAILPQLIAYPDDPQADRRELEALAVRMDRYSPAVHIEGDATLLLDVTGCERLFHGEDRLLRRVMDEVRGGGFIVRGAIADTAGAAWALVHAHRESQLIVEPGQTCAALAELPVWALRVDAGTVEALDKVGIESIASLLYMPRSSLAARFGHELLDRVDQALGDLPEPLTPHRPAATLSEVIELGGATDRRDVLTEACRVCIERFCVALASRVAGVCRMFVTFRVANSQVDRVTPFGHPPWSPSAPLVRGEARPLGKEEARFPDKGEARSITFDISLSRPTRSARHLWSLWSVKLDDLRLPGPVEAVTVWTSQIESLADRQYALFEGGIQDREVIGDLLDRLVLRLGSQAVLRAQAVADHQPERAFEYVPIVRSEIEKARQENKCEVQSSKLEERQQGNKATRQGGKVQEDGERKDSLCEVASDWSGRKEDLCAPLSNFELRTSNFLVRQLEIGNCRRPLRLLPRPLEIATTSLVPDGPPIAFRFQGDSHTIADRVGPERIETGWWRGPHLRRDYYRVTTDIGRRCWLFRERNSGKWFLHGWFD